MSNGASAPAIPLHPSLHRLAVPWSRVPVFDWCFIILGGLPLILPLVLLSGESILAQREPVYWYYWMNACISAPHVYSTYHRLTRKIHQGRVSWLVGWPAYLAWAGLLGVASSHGWYLQALTGVNVWQSFHYVRQVYGVSRIYTRHTVDAVGRRLSFLAYHLAMPLFVLGRWDLLYTVWGGRPSEAIIPVDVSPWLLGACWNLAGAGLLVGLFSEWREARRHRAAYDWVAIANLVVYYAIFAFGFLSAQHYQRGFFAVTIYHAVQYLGLMWVLERRCLGQPLRQATDNLPKLLTFALFWSGFFLVGLVFERHITVYGNRFWPMFSGVALAAISAHHYFVDTIIWRSRSGP